MSQYNVYIWRENIKDLIIDCISCKTFQCNACSEISGECTSCVV